MGLTGLKLSLKTIKPVWVFLKKLVFVICRMFSSSAHKMLSNLVYNFSLLFHFSSQKPLGLLSLLDEESTFPNGTDLTFANKLKQHLNSNSCFRGERDKAFTVCHYAGEVCSPPDGFHFPLSSINIAFHTLELGFKCWNCKIFFTLITFGPDTLWIGLLSLCMYVFFTQKNQTDTKGHKLKFLCRFFLS